MRFGSFFMAEYINMIVISALAVTLFLGGWHGPGPGFLDPIWVLVKMFVFLFLFVWVRATLPRLRYDQLMSFGWKVLLPLATVNALVTANRGGPGGNSSMSLKVSYADDVYTVERGPDPGGVGAVYRVFGETLRGLKTTMSRWSRVPSRPVPRAEGAGLPALPRQAQAQPLRGLGAREVRRLLAVRRRLPGRLHPRRRRREHARQPGVRRRALRRGLRDQHAALHLLRLLRGRVPVRRDHDGSRLRAVRLHALAT